MNKRTEQTRWTPKRLLSLLMALIMTLSLLPTAALAAATDYTINVTNPLDTQLLVGQESSDITATLTANSSVTTPVKVRLKVTVTTPIGTGNCTIQYENSSGAYVPADDGYLDDGANYLSVSSGSSVSAKFKLKCDNPARYSYKVEAFEEDSTAGTWSPISSSFISSFWGMGDINNLTVTPANPEAGQPFTVRADTNVNNGYVVFEYNGVQASAPVNPLLENKGYAEYRGFTAVDSVTEVKATLPGAAGIPDVTKTTHLTGVTTPATYHTVTFLAGAADAYIPFPTPATVEDGAKYTIPTTPPTREGYEFKGWSVKSGTATLENGQLTNVKSDVTLEAQWARKRVKVVITKDTNDVTVLPSTFTGTVSTAAHFGVTVPAKYDAAKMTVLAGTPDGEHKYLVPESQHIADNGDITFYYQFTVTEGMFAQDPDTGEQTLPVAVDAVTEKTFTVMMPVGHFTAQIKAVDSIGSTKAADGISASIVYGGGYTFTVTPDEGYTVKRVAVNGATIDKNDDGSYTVSKVTTAQTVEVVVDELPVYIVIYNSNNSQYAFQCVTAGSKAALPADPVVEGYTFGGWYTEQNGAGTQFTAETGITGDITVYAKLTAKTYQISYNANTTDTVTNMPTANQLKTHGLAEKLSETVPTREGYTFLGWGTTATATAASYQPGDMYSVDGDIELYAVWQQKTYTITFSSGEGYSLHNGHASMTVAHGANFDFNLIVDRDYAENEPKVWKNTDGVNSGEPLGNGTPTINQDGSKKYHYTLTNVTENIAINVDVRSNTIYTVTFMTNGSIYQTQQVGYNEKATRPVDPVVEGYKFEGWYKEADYTTPWYFVDTLKEGSTTEYYPANTVKENTTIYAKLTPIEPVITWPTTTTGYTMKVEYTAPGAATAPPAELTTTPGSVPYNSVVTFTIKILDGYDASKMQVGINGVLHAPKSIVDNVYTFEFTAKQDTNITVVGVARKTVTIIYNANARDDVSGMPEAQTVKYYLDAVTADNDTIVKQFPVRTGYKFLGWSTNSEAKVADDGYGVDLIKDGKAVSKFTENTTLYAVWEAVETNVTLKITDVAYDTQQNNRVIQYEGEQITLQATLNVNAKGTVVFYKGDKEGTNGTRIGSAAINGKTAELSVKVGDYKAGGVTEHYWAVFESETDEGYANSEKSNIMNVGVFSKALSWKITDGTSNVADNGNVLNVYEGDSATGTPITGNMVAGHTYTLQVKTASITGVETLDSKQPVLGKDYKIVWQYTEVGKNDWKTDGEASDKATYLVTGDKSGYQFRAQIVPLGPDNGSLFIKAGKFNENDVLVNDQYDTCLYTKSTNTTVRQATATALTITGAETESKDVWVNGATDKFGRDHLAQFEGQTVTLTATVTDTTTGTPAVTTGFVDFYRKGATAATKLNASPIAVGANGVATCEVEISKWTGGNVTDNKDEFYAVYLANATYDTSDSKTTPQTVYIKSAKLMTPIIESELEGTNGAKATTYSKDLTGLLAGVQHTFKLRQTGAEATTGDWSVVALDGRTVEAKNYDIKWLKTTGSNEQEVDATGTNQIKVDENKVDDRYRVKLTGKGVFAGSEATSKDAVIGTKQNVTVTVKALDAIESTAATDVYQLNEITLTATVAAANDKPTMPPTGTVTFYYKDGENWVKLDSATLAEDTNHSMTASITTNKLPVTDTTNTWRNVEITAVYEGNDTFNASATVNETEKSITAAAGCTTTNDTVTVYSSVVFNCNDENKKQTTDGDKGIHISVIDGAFKTNEKATLALSDIYTLDRNLDKALLNTIAKLNPTTDYTVQWQKLNGATAITSGDYGAAENWTNIDGKTGTTLVLDKVEQNTAYRAVITVKDQPITKGSFDKLDQGVIGTADANDGRQVYYSNVLMPTDTNMTVSVALNTSKIGAENTEGITEGETVTANVFLSGVVGAVPNANVTVKVTNDSAKGNDTAYEKTFTSMNTVNGWNAFSWNTAESDDKGVPTAPGFYTLTVSATTNTGYAAKEITRSLIVRESSYDFNIDNRTTTYNGQTQGVTVTLNGFDFKGKDIKAAAEKSWTVKYYKGEVKPENLVEPSQAGTYKAVVTLPGSAYWTEQTKTVDFTIEKRSVSIADAIAQAKVYDGTTDVNIVEVMLNDAVTDQTTNGTGLPTNNVGIINGDSIYAVATEAKLSSANAGDNSFTISTIALRGDDAANYVWDNDKYTENIYVSRSQVYGVSSTDVTLKAGEKLPADAVYMIDQAGNKITTYDVLYYLHTDTEIKKVDNTNEKGLYTVIVRPKQDNYKSGVTLRVTVGDATGHTPAVAPKPSTLITISNTAELYGAATGVTASTTNSTATTTIEYQSGSTGWTTTAPTSAGRYLVRVTANTGDVAYGIYTITKAHPSIDVTPATGLTYNSMPQNGYTTLTGVEGKDASKDYYITYAGDVAIGYNTPADGNVDEQAPVDAGTYTVTLHVNETANYTAHEVSTTFTIKKAPLTITADSWQTTQYDAFPDMTAKYEGLAAVDTDTTPDTSLRDVQIAPEYLYNPTNGKSNYNNDTLDQVGYVAIQPVDALSKNYAITYENGQYTKQRTETNVDFAIHGLPQSGDRTVNRVYYGDEIQLYPYGYYTTHANGSGILEWSVTTATGFKGTVTIGKETGLLNVNGVGEFTVTLKRGVGEQQIKTEINVTAIKKEAKIALKNVDKVYNGASQTYAYEGNVTVHDELYQPIGNFVDSKLTRTNTARTNVGTQITTAQVTGALAYQSEIYGGKFTINDKDATVTPVADAHIYGTTRTIPSLAYTSTDSNAISNVLTASQTDAYNRLDVHDGYEILVAGTEDMNYNVKYTTDHNDTAKNAEDSAVTTYQDVVFTSKTDKYLNDATIYGETPNVLDWTLVNVIGTTRDSVDYADNLADFDLPDTFVEQDKDDCTGNKVTYKAANRTTEISGSTVEYNQAALTGPRTSTDTATDENYTLKFNTVENSGKALLANNYKLTNVKTGNSEATTNALTANSKGFIPAAGESNDVSGENFVEGSANIAQRPIKLEKAVTDAQLYWRLPQSQLYTALVNVLKAEENSVGRGLAKGHTIEDLDLSFTIGSTPVDKNNDQPMNFTDTGKKTVTVTVGDTNYKLEGSNTFEVDFQTMRIRATYYNKTFTGFDVRIEKIDAAGNSVGPLDSTKGLTFKVLKQTNGVLDTETDYAANKSFTFVSKDGTYGYFHGSYSPLPLLGNGELYVFQMYEYGVPLERK